MKPYSLSSHAGTCWHIPEHRSYLINIEPYGDLDVHRELGHQTLVRANFVGLVQYHKNCVRIDAKKDRFRDTDIGLMGELREQFPSLHRLMDSYWITEFDEMIQFKLTYA